MNRGIMSFTPFIQDFHKITLDFCEGINCLRNIGGNWEMNIHQRIAQMGMNESLWFETLASASARAFHGDAQGIALRDLSDEELKRVFGPCANPQLLIAAVTSWREGGRSFSDFMSFTYPGEIGIIRDPANGWAIRND